MQRYAAEIYRLQQDQLEVALADISAHVKTSTQAVSRMVKRLKHGGYLNHELYRGVRLTQAGERIAMPAIRRHRLVENFLVKIMAYNWAEAHALADTFELGVNDALEDRIDKLTGHPTRCPHGEPIPDKHGIMPTVEDIPLVEVETGWQVRISRVRTHEYDKLMYFAELGMVPGKVFYFTGCAPFKGPLRLYMDKQDVILGHELATALRVELVEKRAEHPAK